MRPPPGASTARLLFPVLPRRRTTGAALAVLVLLQAVLFFAVTRRSFFFADDYNYFKLAQDRSFLRYLFTPILGVYPAPGDRLASFLLHEVSPLNFTAARTILILFLVGTTVLLWQLVSTLAGTDEWWTVALVVPLALSITLVLPLAWWSAGLPILPALFFTVVAVAAWIRSYTEPRQTWWVAVAVIAVAAAGAFYMKFLLIPAYLAFLRLAILPRLLGLPGGVGRVWADERARWIALATPPVAFVAVLVFSGLAGRSAAAGPRPYLDFFTTAWFEGLVPATFMNARTEGGGPLPGWAVVVASQMLLAAVIGATWRRSALAVRAWAMFVFAFVVNTATVGTARLPAFGVEIAYELRYYPEIVLFLPLALALALRQGEERRAGVAWEKTTAGRTAMASMACLYVVSFLVWAPEIVTESPGVPARAWYENLRRDIGAVAIREAPPRIVDSETPEYVMPKWMAPDNRVSTIVSLVPLDVVFNELSPRLLLVREDGRLAQATFRPFSLLLSGVVTAEGVRVVGGERVPSTGTCVQGGGRIVYRPPADIAAERVAMKISYSRPSTRAIPVEVDTYDSDVPQRHLELRPFEHAAELVDLRTPRLRGLQLEVSSDDGVCIERMEIGSLDAGPANATEPVGSPVD